MSLALDFLSFNRSLLGYQQSSGLESLKISLFILHEQSHFCIQPSLKPGSSAHEAMYWKNEAIKLEKDIAPLVARFETDLPKSVFYPQGDGKHVFLIKIYVDKENIILDLRFSRTAIFGKSRNPKLFFAREYHKPSLDVMAHHLDCFLRLDDAPSHLYAISMHDDDETILSKEIWGSSVEDANLRASIAFYCYQLHLDKTRKIES